MNALITHNDAVTEINRIVRRRGLEATLELGTYLLEVFFENSEAAYRKRGPKDTSLREVADDKACEVALATLVRCVGTKLLTDAQPALLNYGLSPIHFRALLTVDDPAKRIALAEKARDQRLTGTDLEKLLGARPRPRSNFRPKWQRQRPKLSRSIKSLIHEPPATGMFAGLTRADAQRHIEAMEADGAAYAAWLTEARRVYDALPR
jgi:hypothetical protein